MRSAHAIAALVAAVSSAGATSAQSAVARQLDPECFGVEGLEVEHLSLLPPPGTPSGWTPPVLDPNPGGHLFEWRVATECPSSALGRNVSVVGAVLTLVPVVPGAAPTVCRSGPGHASRVLCGGDGPLSARFNATLELTLRSGSSAQVTIMARGSFIHGLGQDAAAWGGAEWIGLPDANDTAVQFQAVADISTLGFQKPGDVSTALLFVAGLGGYRATVNGRAVDPTSVRASVTEWHNRTFYFADDVTADVVNSISDAGGSFAVGIELFKHWYALSNNFYQVPYGPRALKAVLALRHVNGTTTTAVPTLPGSRSSWRHGSGALVFDDLHAGQTTDGRRATPGWEAADFDAEAAGWTAPLSVSAPPGQLLPHPMPRSRALERVLPVNASVVPSSAAGTTHRFTLPYEVAGFCTVLLPMDCPAGASITLRHGECVDPRSNLLCPVEAPAIQNSSTDVYFCRGSAAGMGANDVAWRRVAINGNASDAAHDVPQQEAFTPTFKFSAFKYLEVSYAGFSTSLPMPSTQSVSCSRIGTGFDWIGDVELGPPAPTPTLCDIISNPYNQTKNCGGNKIMSGFMAAERLNAVVAAARSTSIANYVMDIPTDSPQEEKRGWLGDSLAAHRTLAALFDMRAAWKKWTEDMAFTQSVLSPEGTITSTVPCVFSTGLCRSDPRGQSKMDSILTGVAWGSALPQLAAFVAALSNDTRFAAKMATPAEEYVTLLQHYTNNASYTYPDLLNITSIVDEFNVYQQGWPASSYGDWCPVNTPPGACTSVSALLNSVYFILDADAAASLARMGGATPSADRLASWAARARKSFSAAFLRNISVPAAPSGALPSNSPASSITGLAYSDFAHYNITHHGNPNIQPTAQVEAAAGMAALDALNQGTKRGALATMLAGLLLNVSGAAGGATVRGGVIDMAQLGRSLVSYGRPDAAFALLSADGPQSLYHMANSTGTLWAHPGGSDGNKGKCSSHNHIMQGGSVGEAIFGLGGIEPGFMRGEVPDALPTTGKLRLAPVPWIPDAPRGAAVWRTSAGVTSTRWEAVQQGPGEWKLWVNATVPIDGSDATLSVMLPQDAVADAVCAWECGLSDESVAGAADQGPAAYAANWIAFDGGGGHWEYTASVPPPRGVAATVTVCSPVWKKGGDVTLSTPGVESVSWAGAEPGRTLFPSLQLVVGSGSYSVFARAC